MEFCDHGHQANEVRRLPYGSKEQGGAVLVCYQHYQEEIAARREKNDPDQPMWDSLKLYTSYPSLYNELKDFNIPIDHHENDLYFRKSSELLAILNRWPQEKSTAREFINQIDGERWIEVPFSYTPFWEAKQKHTGVIHYDK